MPHRLISTFSVLALVFTAIVAMSWAGQDDALPVAADTPEASVESLHGAIIAAMKIPGAEGYPRRVELLDPVVRSLFDFRTISRLVLGPHWRDADAARRDAFLEVFGRHSVANYASEFDSFSDHAFRTDETIEGRRGVVVVRSTLTTGRGETHRFDYQLREKDGRWLIIGVAVDGVNDIAMKRSQYEAVVRRDGFDALLDALEKQIRNFEQGQKDND